MGKFDDLSASVLITTPTVTAAAILWRRAGVSTSRIPFRLLGAMFNNNGVTIMAFLSGISR